MVPQSASPRRQLRCVESIQTPDPQRLPSIERPSAGCLPQEDDQYDKLSRRSGSAQIPGRSGCRIGPYELTEYAVGKGYKLGGGPRVLAPQHRVDRRGGLHDIGKKGAGCERSGSNQSDTGAISPDEVKPSMPMATSRAYLRGNSRDIIQINTTGTRTPTRGEEAIFLAIERKRIYETCVRRPGTRLTVQSTAADSYWILPEAELLTLPGLGGPGCRYHEQRIDGAAGLGSGYFTTRSHGFRAQ